MNLDEPPPRPPSAHNNCLAHFDVRCSLFGVRCSLLAALFAFSPTASLAGSSDVHLTYHWHLHQPIYWPEKAGSDNRYQNAKDSIDLKISNTGNFYAGSTHKHPRNNLVNGDGGEYDSVFDKDDRKIAYQHGGRDSIGTLAHHADGGASVSYSGALQENVRSLARTCANYMDVAHRGTSGWNIDPPNRADRLGPSIPAGQWWNGQIDGRGGNILTVDGAVRWCRFEEYEQLTAEFRR